MESILIIFEEISIVSQKIFRQPNEKLIEIFDRANNERRIDNFGRANNITFFELEVLVCLKQSIF